MNKSLSRFAWLLGLALASCLAAMALLPLMDTTEARYAEIARIMAETGDWITPWFDYGVPFWGKPPLSFWSQALSFRLLGVSEFAVRLPSLLATLGILWLIFGSARQLAGRSTAWLAVTIYGTSALGYVMAGAVLTDPFLTLGITLTLAAALRTGLADKPPPLWGYLVFAGVGIGLLAKGPLALVLLAPLGIWLLAGPRARLRRFPWLGGTLLALAISLPWYIAAEWKTPGFLDYFIAGEHFKRFVDSGWQGDLYGTAHRHAFGTIWWYALLATFPWGLIAAALLFTGVRRRAYEFPSSRWAMNGRGLLLAWMLWPLIFFTFAGNILWTYVQPALPSFAILLAIALRDGDPRWSRWGIRVAASVPATVLVLALVVHGQPERARTEKKLVQFIRKDRGAGRPKLLYLDSMPFSARFYSAGSAQKVDLNELNSILRKPSAGNYYLAIPREQVASLPSPLAKRLQRRFVNRRYALYRALPNAQAAATLVAAPVARRRD